MSACPADWQTLLAHRFDALADEPAELDAALAHLDDCAACRRRACAVDPSLAFRFLGAGSSTGSGSPNLDFAAEAERMRLAVAGMQAARRVEARSHRRRARLAVAAGLAAALGGGLWFGIERVGAPGSSAAPRAALPSPLRAAGADVREAATAPDSAMVDSVIEAVGGSEARVYQLAGEQLSVVMIVDESLDV